MFMGIKKEKKSYTMNSCLQDITAQYRVVIKFTSNTTVLPIWSDHH